MTARATLLSMTAATALLFAATDATAYRPFDGTDADVAEPGTFELELGPAHYYAQRGNHYLLAPVTVLNFGLVPRLELVIDFTGAIGLERVPGEEHVRIIDTDVFLKYVIRRGELQDEHGPSIAVEGGPLTPEYNGDSSFGAQCRFIVSHRWDGGAVHFNEQIAYTRAGTADLFSSVILEGSRAHAVRPVTELYVERELGEATSLSALVGAIWSVSESLNFDVGLREARVDGKAAAEVRLGLTWAVRVLGEPAKTENARSRPLHRTTPAALAMH